MASQEWRLQSHAFDLQKELSEFTFQQNMQATQDERNYNTPSAQLARLRAAGLNPMFYGLDGNSSNGAPFTMSTPQAPDGSADVQRQIGNMQAIQTSISQMMQASKNLAEIRQMDEQTRLLSKQSSNVDADTRLKNIDSQWRPLKNGMELRVGASSIKVNMSQSDVNTESAREIKKRADNYQVILDNIASDTRVNDATSDLRVAEKAVAASQVGLNQASASNQRSQSAFWKQHSETERAQTGIAWEKYAQEQMNTGLLPQRFMNDNNLTKAQIKQMDSSAENLSAFARVAQAQEDGYRQQLIINGIKVGIVKDVKNNTIIYDIPAVHSINTANKINNTIGTYAKLYEDWMNTQSNSLNATANVVSSVIPGIKLKLGTQNPVASPSTPSYSSHDWY